MHHSRRSSPQIVRVPANTAAPLIIGSVPVCSSGSNGRRKPARALPMDTVHGINGSSRALMSEQVRPLMPVLADSHRLSAGCCEGGGGSSSSEDRVLLIVNDDHIRGGGVPIIGRRLASKSLRQIKDEPADNDLPAHRYGDQGQPMVNEATTGMCGVVVGRRSSRAAAAANRDSSSSTRRTFADDALEQRASQKTRSLEQTANEFGRDYYYSHRYPLEQMSSVIRPSLEEMRLLVAASQPNGSKQRKQRLRKSSSSSLLVAQSSSCTSLCCAAASTGSSAADQVQDAIVDQSIVGRINRTATTSSSNLAQIANCTICCVGVGVVDNNNAFELDSDPKAKKLPNFSSGKSKKLNLTNHFGRASERVPPNSMIQRQQRCLDDHSTCRANGCDGSSATGHHQRHHQAEASGLLECVPTYHYNPLPLTSTTQVVQKHRRRSAAAAASLPLPPPPVPCKPAANTTTGIYHRDAADCFRVSRRELDEMRDLRRHSRELSLTNKQSSRRQHLSIGSGQHAGNIAAAVAAAEAEAEVAAVTQMYESLAAELKAKLGNPKAAPILLPPKDYDTISRRQGKLDGIDTRRSTNPQLIGPAATVAMSEVGGNVDNDNNGGNNIRNKQCTKQQPAKGNNSCAKIQRSRSNSSSGLGSIQTMMSAVSPANSDPTPPESVSPSSSSSSPTSSSQSSPLNTRHDNVARGIIQTTNSASNCGASDSGHSGSGQMDSNNEINDVASDKSSRMDTNSSSLDQKSSRLLLIRASADNKTVDDKQTVAGRQQSYLDADRYQRDPEEDTCQGRGTHNHLDRSDKSTTNLLRRAESNPGRCCQQESDARGKGIQNHNPSKVSNGVLWNGRVEIPLKINSDKRSQTYLATKQIIY